MESIREHILKTNVQTDDVKIEDIQEVVNILKQVRDDFGYTDEYLKYCLEILKILWQHMETGFIEFNDQLLCSTCFYTILSFSDGREYYLEKVLNLLNTEIDYKEKGMETSKKIFNTISLTYGIFQSSILQQTSEDPIMSTILYKIFTLLTLLAYDYSQYTFITFKIMTFFKKVAGTGLQDIIFNKTHNFKLLNVINHNWENPITGVRGLNKIIFHNLLSTVDIVVYEVIEQKLNGFYWNKAKYLMLAEIIEKYQSNTRLLDKYDLVEGLVYSLKKDGLVSAGADMYVAVLKKITSEEEWCAIFLNSIIEIVKDSSIKPIENFKNYWCLNTLKKIPSLSQILFDEVIKLDICDHKLYSCLSIIQQSNKLGLLGNYRNNWDFIRQLVFNNMDYNVDHVRVTSFDIMCGLHRKCLPDEEDFDLIVNFLVNNVNSDCSTLRLTMIKSLQNFLVQLHITFANKNWNNEDYTINLLKFCKKLQIFIVESLDLDGNYQRKIATIQITNVMLKTFKDIPKKQQKGTKKLHSTLMDFIKSRKQWILSEKQFILKLISLLKDPSDDVRDHVKEVLIYNYCEQLSKSDFIIYLTEEALLCIRSKFFYQIACGQTIFKIIVNILLLFDCSDSQFKKVEDIFNFAYNELKSETHMEIDIIKSIVGGKQQHSYLSILHCIFEVSLEHSHKLNIPMNIIYSLMEILKITSNQFKWEQEGSVSSDFSKMNDMVEKIITNSEYKISSPNNETNISGLHQIVLNCLWLNVKASCELCAILIRYFKNDVHNDLCEQSLNIICNVLETSRHKGAIESGGTALGQAIQQLTSLQGSSLNSKLPMSLLRKKLNQLVLETNNMASVTRRGAGLSIMIHRIVSSDMKKGKPLFHYFMKTLLETCNKLPESCNNYKSEEAISNEKDLPKAIYIHFLTKIVTDSSLASDMMYYSGVLAKLAFDNLSSSCWQIRNAALQLYGSLIPKLIGQKKNSCVSEEVRATVAVDEFRTHSPKLWEYIETQLKLTTKPYSDIVQCHNNLVPILSILANLAPIYTFTNEMEYSKQLLQSLINFLGSPIYVVRRLTSKCILNIYTFEVILDVLLNATCETENSLHGTLLLLNQFNKQYNIKDNEEKGSCLQNRFKVLTASKGSYLSKESFERTYPEFINLNEKMIQETLSELNNNINAPGVYLWANFRIEQYLENALWKEIPQIILLISKCSDFEAYLEFLCNRIQIDKSIEREILVDLCNILYVLGFRKNSTMIWRILYEISLFTDLLPNQIDKSLIHQYLLKNEVSYGMRYTIPFAARLFNVNEELILLSNIVFTFCCPEIDVAMRLIAATAINELANKFGSMLDDTKINIIKTVTMLLQDEDEDVRKLSVHFYRIVNMDEKALHPYVCWRKILSKKFLYQALNKPQTAIQSICSDLLELIESIDKSNDDEYNPFANDSKNIYLEPNSLKKVLSDLKTV